LDQEIIPNMFERPSRLRTRARLASERLPPARFAYRLGLVALHRRMAAARPRDAAWYVLHSRELTNFTYELQNERELAMLVARALRADEQQAAGYLRELREDAELNERLDHGLRSDPRRDDVARLGKRRALYATVRMARPRVVVETGLYDGLATAVLLRALQRNESEGDPGRLLGFDLEEASAWLVWDELGDGRFERHIGDSVKLLPGALGDEAIDLFVHDTDKVEESERAELQLAVEHGSERLIIYTDDDSVTGTLRAICAEQGGRGAFIREQPERHFWRGNLLGLCVIVRQE
jgi:predicted O-methyltransferase YrrM